MKLTKALTMQMSVSSPGVLSPGYHPQHESCPCLYQTLMISSQEVILASAAPIPTTGSRYMYNTLFAPLLLHVHYDKTAAAQLLQLLVPNLSGSPQNNDQDNDNDTDHADGFPQSQID